MQKYTSSTSRSKLITALTLSMGVSLVSACSSSDSPAETQMVPEDDGPGVSTDNSVNPVNVPVVPVTAGAVMFPEDFDDDDRPGLVVTGLDGMDPEDVSSPWLVNAQMFRLASKTPGTGDGFVDLLQYRDDFRLVNHIDFFDENLGFCDIDDPDARQPIGDEGGDDDGSPPPFISGGETVVINAQSGPWFIFARGLNEENGNFFYETDNGLPGTLPEGATLSIPGDDFPTVAAHPLYEPAPPVRLLPTDASEYITSESEYSWIPGNTAAYVKINLLAYSGPDEFKGFYVNCTVEDDGEFTMPGAVVNYLDSTEYDFIARYSRVYARLDFVNGIVVFQRNEVAE